VAELVSDPSVPPVMKEARHKVKPQAAQFGSQSGKRWARMKPFLTRWAVVSSCGRAWGRTKFNRRGVRQALAAKES